MAIRRGDVYWVDWNPARGSEQAGRRPGLVISNDLANEHASIVILAAMTTRRPSRPYPFLVAVTAAETGLAGESTVNCLQLLAIDKARLVPAAAGGASARPAGRLSTERMLEIDRALKAALALT